MGDHTSLAGVGLTGPSTEHTDPDRRADLSLAVARFAPGTTVVLRHVRARRYRAVKPLIVVEDSDERIALFMPRGTRFYGPADRWGRPTRSLTDEVGLVADRWRDAGALHVVTPGAAHAAVATWHNSFDGFSGWYVNFQEPLRRTSIGWDTMDQTLDLVVSPDLADLSWKDRTELDDATRAGFYTEAERRAILAEADAVAATLISGGAPFTEPWAAWRPDPTWPSPVLPPDWSTAP